MDTTPLELPDLLDSEIAISIANSVEIYKLDDVDRAVYDSANISNDSLKLLYAKMRRDGGGVRYCVRPSGIDVLDPLYERCPNFSYVLDDIKKHIALSVSGNEAISFTPVLLLGDPGIGKTHFARRLAGALGVRFEFVPMNSLTAGWVLTGSSSQWSQSKIGRVAEALINGPFANPLIALDEIDKSGGDSRYNPMGALYTLLEKETARCFKDEFVDLEIDASHILWVATANDASAIPAPILSRMNVYTIPSPSKDQSIVIASTLYLELLAEHNWGFPADPPIDVMSHLATFPPRDMRKILMSAFGSAKLSGRDELIVEDICPPKTPDKRRVGF